MRPVAFIARFSNLPLAERAAGCARSPVQSSEASTSRPRGFVSASSRRTLAGNGSVSASRASGSRSRRLALKAPFSGEAESAGFHEASKSVGAMDGPWRATSASCRPATS